MIFQWLGIFSVAIIVVMIWTMIIIPESEKLTDIDLMDMEYEGQDKIVDNIYGNMTEQFFTQDNLSQEVINRKGNELTIKSTVTSIRSDTREMIFHVENIYHVDALTQMHIDKKDKKFGFTPGVEKKDYSFFHPAVFYDAPLMYKKMDNVNGLDVYVFEVIIEGADASKSFPQFSGHTILTDNTSRLYVEPITGNIVKFEKEWNNYLVEDGKNISTIEIGKKYTTEFTELVLVHLTQEKIENIQFNRIIMPIFLIFIILGSGTIWILFGYLERIRKESVKNEKLALIGDMTAKLSHDLRNPLTIIKNGFELFELGLPEEKRKDNMKRIQNAVDRISYEIEAIMNFVRDNPLHKEQISLRRIIDITIENIEIPEGIKIEKEIPDITINVDREQILRVFSNIIINAIDAMKNGKITIIAKSKTKTIEIEFTDSGPGIPKDKIDKIFQPLFTTKSKGTGLGLSICKTLIEKHGGGISVKNNPTRFTVILPK
ncbi:Signal transduction histidine kinase [Candidatus Nitrosarchaeum limnium SFB1]|uniref:Signal transduction histidine kinase n=1 Tax=Candidatus Nitrosarchaeum limnium SFB1 TaxID=886738 RepID=F3KKZ2_9ARCH|nr:Signal transduction histidine kinase [Candidatus Nitrosarchaeum limnium SFB1]